MTPAAIAEAVRWLEEADAQPPLCSKVVSVLGDERFYSCALKDGHEGCCVPDYDAAA